MSKSSNEGKKKIYYNRPQREAMYILANKEYHVWSRRTGKDYGLVGPRTLLNVKSMPRTLGAMIFPTFRMGLAQILPNTIATWEQFGYKEGVHFLVGKDPPSKWKWPKPYKKPRYPEHNIYWWNGSVMVMISQDRPGTSNSYDLDWLVGNEARFLNYEKLKTETLPAVSGSYWTIRQYKNHPRFKSMLFCTDMPVLKEAQWILEMEKEVDWQLIRLIKYYRRKIATSSSQKERVKHQRVLNRLRAEAIYYSEASVLDNIKIVGEKYIRDKKRELPPFEFRTSILNVRPTRIQHGFYNLFGRKHLLPVRNNNEVLERFDYDFKQINDNLNCRLDNDIDVSIPLVIAEDHNADINSLVISQPHYDIGEIWFLKSMYVKMPSKFIDLIKKFIKYYEPLRDKNNDVIYYYDSTSIKRSDLTTETNAELVTKTLEQHGWNVTPVYLGNPDRHDVRFDNWERSFAGEGGLFPKFNKYNCYDLLVAMQQTGIKHNRSRSGWGKDKSQEHKHFETEQQEPHLTDAMDTAKRGCEQMPQDPSLRHSMGNIYPE